LSTEPPILLDTDFVSSFAWVDRLDLIERLDSRRMVILEEAEVVWLKMRTRRTRLPSDTFRKYLAGIGDTEGGVL